METLEVEVELDEPTFWGAVGWPGIALYGLALAVAGTHVYIAAEYTFYFRDMQVEGVWVFLLLAGLFVLTLVAHGCRWKNLAKTVVRNKERESQQVMSIMALWRKVTSVGPWYCWKVYFLEIVESNLDRAVATDFTYSCLG